MIIKTIFGAIADWWRELFTMALANFLWFLLLLPIVTGPPATAAMMALARETMMRRRVGALDIFPYMRPYLLRSWGLVLILLVGIAIAIVDFIFFLEVLGGMAGLIGFSLILYLTILWLQVHYYTWAMMVVRPDLTVGQMLRNGLIITMRRPGFGVAITLFITFLLLLSIVVPPLLGLATVGLIALLSVRGLANAVPELLPEDERLRLKDLEEADKADEITTDRRRGRDDV